jgi:hypothetical protein
MTNTNTTATDQITKAQEWALEQMKANQERVIDLNRKVASLVEKLPNLPKVKVPFADRLPDQKTIVSKYFDFVVKSSEANRDFAQAIVGVWSDDAEKPKPAAKPRAAAKAS